MQDMKSIYRYRITNQTTNTPGTREPMGGSTLAIDAEAGTIKVLGVIPHNTYLEIPDDTIRAIVAAQATSTAPLVFCYVLTKKKNDRNGNPADTFNIWQQTTEGMELINRKKPYKRDYRGVQQAVIEELVDLGLIPDALLEDRTGTPTGHTRPDGKRVWLKDSLYALSKAGLLRIEELY